ncbi:MAG: YdcF family protein [Polyangiaceae bacterium]|nr:YdcF family protein [Polyangiaceae bacterium]MCB9608804.1 YdcF family protein [Polyangiaceae bacterium]
MTDATRTLVSPTLSGERAKHSWHLRDAKWGLARGVAAFFGGFSALNALGDALAPGFDASGWWVDLRGLPHWLSWCVVLLSAIVLGAFAARPRLGTLRRQLTIGWSMLLMAFCGANAIAFSVAVHSGRIHTPRPIPVSALIFVALLSVMLCALKNDFRPGRFAKWRAVAVLALVAFACPVAQMVLFGKTDYRRPADAVVVFGARVYPNGKPSLALADRVRTASRLVTSGKAEWLVVSGGPGDRGTHETLAMRRLAIRMGVPANRILVDRQGLTTHDTVQNSVPMLKRIGAKRVLAVSHFYHLPRIKLAYQRAGVEVYTVPATESRRLRKLPWFMTREVAALWLYYVSPLT